jgi:hypothetical protein
MFRPSASPRRLLGVALAVSAGTAIGLGAPSLWSGATTPRAYVADTSSIPAGAGVQGVSGGSTAPAPASLPLTIEDAKAIAVQTAPGRVVEWDEDQEATGLRYDVTVLHDDGTTTDIEVDATTGRVVSTQHDDWDGS